MILHEAQAYHLLSHRRQTETFQNRRGEASPRRTERTDADPPDAGSADPANNRAAATRQHRLQIPTDPAAKGVNQERANILAADLNQIRVRTITEPLRALHVQRNRR